MLLILLNNSCGAKAVERTGLDVENPTPNPNPNPDNQTSNGNNTDNLNRKVAWNTANADELKSAIKNDEGYIVEGMLSNISNIDEIKLQYKDKQGEDREEKLVLVAARLDKPNALKALIKLKININVNDQSGKPAVAITAEADDKRCFDVITSGIRYFDSMLVKYGDYNRTFLMHMAQTLGKEHYVKEAVIGSRLSDIDDEGNTAIMIAYTELNNTAMQDIDERRVTAQAILLSRNSFELYQSSKSLESIGIAEDKQSEVLDLVMNSDRGLEDFKQKCKEWQNRSRPRLG